MDDVRTYLPEATVMMGVPTYYTRLLAEDDFGPEDCTSIRMFTSGSAPMTPPVFAEFAARTGHTICERYGMTECGIITSNPPEGQRLAGTVGYALPKVEMRVVDDEGTAVEPDVIGTVEVRGPNVFPGYWQLPEKTAEEMTDDGFFRTGDIGSMAADGRLTLVGRSSDMIISGGYNVYPKEIELLLDSVAGVTETAVVGLPHPDFGEGVAAFVVGEPSLDETVSRRRWPSGWPASSIRRRTSSWTASPVMPWARCRRAVCGPTTPRRSPRPTTDRAVRSGHSDRALSETLSR